MSERPTQTQTSSATEADRLRLNARAGRSGAYQGMAAGQSLADRAAQFRNGAPFLVERATLYDPDPLEPQEQGFPDLPPTRSVLPAALTLLGVVVIAGLAAGVIFVRNADVPRNDELAGRIEQFSEPALPQQDEDASNRWDTAPYDLTRRSTDTIVGAWRPGKTAATEPARDSETAMRGVKPPDPPKRRPMPQRIGSIPPAERANPQPAAPVARTGPATRPAAEIVTAAPTPAQAPTPPTVSTATPARTEAPVSPPAVAEKSAPNVVARVGRTSEPTEAEPREPEGRTASRQRRVDDDDDDDARSRGHANRMSLSRYRRWRAERARRRANRPDPYDAILTEKAAQGIGFYGVHRQSP